MGRIGKDYTGSGDTPVESVDRRLVPKKGFEVEVKRKNDY